MTYISSDTNVWIDFMIIDSMELPFRLPYIFIMSEEAVEDELLSPPGLGEQLTSLGLVSVENTIDEFLLADEYGNRYKKLSVYDRIALAIAKCRNITLLTGDRALRKAARRESVNVIGTLGIIDQLFDQDMITTKEYETCLKRLQANNGKGIRLPEAEIISRLQQVIGT
jgi:predicted nucleic acid-binding protein